MEGFPAVHRVIHCLIAQAGGCLSNRFDCQLSYISWMGAVKFRTQQLGKITQQFPWFPRGLDYLFILAEFQDAGR
jgi:hypothetical protein